MQCANCGHDNPEVNRFCGMCGSILDRRRNTGGAVVAMPRRAGDETPIPSTPEITAETPRAEERRASANVSEPEPAAGGTPSLSGVGIAPASPAVRKPPATERQAEPSFSIFGVDTGAPAADLRRPVEGLHGPSFLGLNEESNPDYLLEDEERGSGRAWLLAVLVLVLAALAVAQYRANLPVRSLWENIKARATGVQPAKPAQEPVATPDVAAGTPAAEQPPAEAPKSGEEVAQGKPEAEPKETGAASEPKSAEAAKAGEPAQVAKAQPPQSDEETKTEATAGTKKSAPALEEEEKPAQARAKAGTRKPEPRDSQAEALVERAQGYLYGRGGRKSCSMALSLLKQAAERGSVKASSQLGAMYATGNCAPYDRAAAYQYFAKAATAEPNNAYLRQNMNMLWREMSTTERRRVLQ